MCWINRLGTFLLIEVTSFPPAFVITITFSPFLSNSVLLLISDCHHVFNYFLSLPPRSTVAYTRTCIYLFNRYSFALTCLRACILYIYPFCSKSLGGRGSPSDDENCSLLATNLFSAVTFDTHSRSTTFGRLPLLSSCHLKLSIFSSLTLVEKHMSSRISLRVATPSRRAIEANFFECPCRLEVQ